MIYSETKYFYITGHLYPKLLSRYFAGVPKRLQITQGPDNITVAIAAAVSMHCAVHGFPVPMVHWFKDGCLLTNCSASFSLHNNGQLLIFRFDKRNIHFFFIVGTFFPPQIVMMTQVVGCTK